MNDDAPRVLVDVEPLLYRQAIGKAMAAAGFRVVMEAPPSDAGFFDAVITESGGIERASPITLVIGDDEKVLVRCGAETGFVVAERPSDLADVLLVLFADRAVR